MDKMNTDLLIQLQAMLGVVDEGEIVADNDYEQSMEMSYDEVRKKYEQRV